MDSGIKIRMTVLNFFDKRIQISTLNTQSTEIIFFSQNKRLLLAKIPISMSGVLYFKCKVLTYVL